MSKRFGSGGVVISVRAEVDTKSGNVVVLGDKNFIGVAVDDALAGEMMAVSVGGIFEFEVIPNLVDPVKAGDNARFVNNATMVMNSGGRVGGIILDDGRSGDIVRVLLNRHS